MSQQAAGQTFVVARIAFSLVGVVILPLAAAASVVAGVAAARFGQSGRKTGG